MNEGDTKNTLDTSLPVPEAAKNLSEEEKKALQLGGDMEHAHGRHREDLEKEITELGDSQ